ncbi:classical arabinogalactan protein 9-like [Cryptomeria japonica]|uniref:classical arabinogalactan protein 9-like n=1 Tax=Cryptomeria japonica TaxID=3369 RepID=UPI0027DA0E40|nr:classical arabinogalactan protein 9-like [Cryptomeria japonica]
MLPRGDLMYCAYYQYKIWDSAPSSMQPSVSLPPPALTSPPSIPVLERVVPHVSSSSRAKANPAPSNKPLCPPRTAQPPRVFVVHATTPSATKGKALVLSKSTARPPFELLIMADIPQPSRYEKMECSPHVPSSQPMSAPFVPPATP